jgi:hypothetical protein
MVTGEEFKNIKNAATIRCRSILLQASAQGSVQQVASWLKVHLYMSSKHDGEDHSLAKNETRSCYCTCPLVKNIVEFACLDESRWSIKSEIESAVTMALQHGHMNILYFFLEQKLLSKDLVLKDIVLEDSMLEDSMSNIRFPINDSMHNKKSKVIMTGHCTLLRHLVTQTNETELVRQILQTVETDDRGGLGCSIIQKTFHEACEFANISMVRLFLQERTFCYKTVHIIDGLRVLFNTRCLQWNHACQEVCEYCLSMIGRMSSDTGLRTSLVITFVSVYSQNTACQLLHTLFDFMEVYYKLWWPQWFMDLGVVEDMHKDDYVSEDVSEDDCRLKDWQTAWRYELSMAIETQLMSSSDRSSMIRLLMTRGKARLQPCKCLSYFMDQSVGFLGHVENMACFLQLDERQTDMTWTLGNIMCSRRLDLLKVLLANGNVDIHKRETVMLSLAISSSEWQKEKAMVMCLLDHGANPNTLSTAEYSLLQMYLLQDNVNVLDQVIHVLEAMVPLVISSSSKIIDNVKDHSRSYALALREAEYPICNQISASQTCNTDDYDTATCTIINHSCSETGEKAKTYSMMQVFDLERTFAVIVLRDIVKRQLAVDLLMLTEEKNNSGETCNDKHTSMYQIVNTSAGKIYYR